MADSNGLISELGQGLKALLPYALPAALGAAMGGPLGGLAGIAEAKGGEAGYQLEQQKTQQEFGLRQAEMLNQAQYRQDLLQDRQDARGQHQQDYDQTQQQRADEFQQRMQQHQDEVQAQQTYKAQMLALYQQGQDLRRQLSMSADATRRDQLAQQLQENTRARIQSAQKYAADQAEKALSHRGHWDRWITERNLSDDEYKQRAYEVQLASSLQGMGYSRDDLLNNGVTPNIVDKIYPPTNLAPPPLRGKNGVVGKDGRKWDIDKDGHYKPASGVSTKITTD